MLKDNQKFFSFLVLVAAILTLVFLASTFDRGASNDIVVQGKLRIIDSAIAGLLAILGMAAQALFRIVAGANETIPVTVENKKSDPVPTSAQAPQAVQTIVDDDELPENKKL